MWHNFRSLFSLVEKLQRENKSSWPSKYFYTFWNNKNMILDLSLMKVSKANLERYPQFETTKSQKCGDMPSK